METVAPTINDNSPKDISIRSVNEEDNLPTAKSFRKGRKKMKKQQKGEWVYSKQFYSKKPVAEWATVPQYNEMFTEENGDVVPYNSFYRQASLAELPELTKNIPRQTYDTDRDTCMILPVEDEKQKDSSINQKAVFPEEDKLFLKEAKLPVEEGLTLKSEFLYAEQALEFMKKLVVPTLVPQTIKDFFLFNIADSRNAHVAKSSSSKFHFSKTFENSVSSKRLVQTYYSEKKTGFQWDPDATEMELSPEKKADLEEKMENNSIYYLERNPNITKEQEDEEDGIAPPEIPKKRKRKVIWEYSKKKRYRRSQNTLETFEAFPDYEISVM